MTPRRGMGGRPSGGFAYAQARLHARLARLPDDPAWAGLEASRSAAHCLALAREGPLAPWVETIDDAGDATRVEARLRERWQRHVDEVARWLPARWQPAVRWFGRLPSLALRDEPGDAAAAAWWRGWQQRLPDGAGDAGDAADARILAQSALWLLPRLDPRATATRAGADADAATGQRLRRLFRRRAGTPPAVFAYLALVALAVERLRGALVARAVFDARRTPASAAGGEGPA